MAPEPLVNSVAIVGAGALGTALAHAFTAAGVRVTAVASRHRERAEALAVDLPGTEAVSVAEAATRAPVVLLAVSDSAIEAACAALEPARGVLVAHTSGSRAAATLAAAEERGARIGSFHPLAAVVSVSKFSDTATISWAALFDGAAFAIEGNDGVRAQLTPLALALGGKPFAISAADKPFYHLGASMLAAFSAGLAQLAWEQMLRAGASPEVASAGVGHLLATVAHNVSRTPSPADAQTGPVARGDVGGVRRQAATARGLSAEAQVLYRAHAAHNIHLAESAGRIDQVAAQALLAVLDAGRE